MVSAEPSQNEDSPRGAALHRAALPQADGEKLCPSLPQT